MSTYFDEFTMCVKVLLKSVNKYVSGVNEDQFKSHGSRKRYLETILAPSLSHIPSSFRLIATSNSFFTYTHIHRKYKSVTFIEGKKVSNKKKSSEIYKLESRDRMNRSDCYAMTFRDVMFCISL